MSGHAWAWMLLWVLINRFNLKVERTHMNIISLRFLDKSLIFHLSQNYHIKYFTLLPEESEIDYKRENRPNIDERNEKMKIIQWPLGKSSLEGAGGSWWRFCHFYVSTVHIVLCSIVEDINNNIYMVIVLWFIQNSNIYLIYHH